MVWKVEVLGIGWWMCCGLEFGGVKAWKVEVLWFGK